MGEPRTPQRDAAGNRTATPPLALDLHYLISAYGQDLFTGETLLGHALMALHEEPVLGRDTIRAALAPNPADPSIPAAVSASRLAEQLEQVRITPSNLNAEEVGRLWAAFMVPMRPSAFCQASVVLIDDTRTFAAALRVREVLSAATGLDSPRVDVVVAAEPPGSSITASSTLVVSDAQLGVDGVVQRLWVQRRPAGDHPGQ